jgi:4-hydroxy-tetrahydrodipicolinate reductase
MQPSDGSVHATVSEALETSEVDVLVDYTSASAVKDNVWTAVRAGVHVVVGSSGLTSSDYDELDRLARDCGVGVIAAGNFSIMAAALRQAAAMVAQHLGHWEIIDYASAGKPDVPSGTSRELAETLGHVRRPASAAPLPELHGPVEARGTEVAGTRIHSVRLPSFVVTTEIVFGGPGERLVMRHDPEETPDPYVDGTLLAIRKVAEVRGVRRGLDSLLFDDVSPPNLTHRNGRRAKRPLGLRRNRACRRKRTIPRHAATSAPGRPVCSPGDLGHPRPGALGGRVRAAVPTLSPTTPVSRSDLARPPPKPEASKNTNSRRRSPYARYERSRLARGSGSVTASKHGLKNPLLCGKTLISCGASTNCCRSPSFLA